MGEQSRCCSLGGGLLCFLGLLILVVVGTGVLAQWEAYSQYKKISADEYSIQIVLDDDTRIDVEAGHYIKLFRVVQRVDIVKADKSNKQVFFNPKQVLIQKKGSEMKSDKDEKK